MDRICSSQSEMLQNRTVTFSNSALGDSLGWLADAENRFRWGAWRQTKTLTTGADGFWPFHGYWSSAPSRAARVDSSPTMRAARQTAIRSVVDREIRRGSPSEIPRHAHRKRELGTV
jgi:hypothetical protein